MTQLRKTAAGVAALAALGLGGAAIAGAAGGDDEDERGETPDVMITGSKADRAGAAATRELGGGTVEEVEKADEGDGSAYEVEVVKDGDTYEVHVGSDFRVVSSERDDDERGGD